MLNSQTAKLSISHRINNENPLFQNVLEISDDAIFIINRSDFNIIDCNNAALKLFEASAKEEIVNAPLFRLYSFKPLDLSIDKVNDELEKNGQFTQELSFKTCKQNTFWGKSVQKYVSFVNTTYSILKISKAANFLREEEWLGEVLNVTSRVTGRQFFKDLTKFLCRTFNAKYAFIARRVAGDEDRLKLFYWYGDKINMHYLSIKDSFIENTLRGYTSYYPVGLGELFPKDKFVKATSADSFIGTPIFDNMGEAFGIIGVLHTDTMEELPNSRYMLSILSSRAASEIQRIRSKEMLRQQTRELAEINLMKDKLISVITSDLHAPLSTILGYSDMLKSSTNEYSAQELTKRMKVMDNTLRNLYAFLENLADWNKLQQKEIRCQLKSNNLSNIIEDTKPYYGYISDLKRITLQNMVPSVLNVSADSYLARAAFRNSAIYLIKNTMNKGRVVFESVLKDGNWYLVLKSENFTSEISDVKFCLEALPQELYNASKDSSIPILGLFIAREFMKLQGGSLNYKFQDSVLELWFEFKKA
jgi:hypothetical protein